MPELWEQANLSKCDRLMETCPLRLNLSGCGNLFVWVNGRGYINVHFWLK